MKLFIKIFLSIIGSQNYDDYNSVQLLSIQELTKLCIVSSHHEKLIYPHLSKFILTTSTKKDNYMLQYTKAYCIDQIIKYRYEYYKRLRFFLCPKQKIFYI